MPKMEVEYWIAAAARFRRQYVYMTRNVSGDYSQQDLLIALSSAEIADHVITYVQFRILGIEKAKIADARLKSRHEIAQLEKDLVDMTCEDDARDILEEIEKRERALIDPSFADEDVEAQKRFTAKKRSSDIRAQLYSYEKARRQDILMGEKQDFANLMAAF